MRLLGNLFHLLTGGLILALGWLAAAIFYALFPATRRLAAPCLQLAILCLWPSSKGLVREAEIARHRAAICGVSLPEDGDAARPWKALNVLHLAVWLPVGIVLISAHMIHGLLMALPSFGNPWKTRSFSLLGAACFPLGWRVVERKPAGAISLADASFRFARLRNLVAEHPVALVSRRAARPAAGLAGAALVLWATSSANEGLLYAPPAESALLVGTEAVWARPVATPVWLAAKPVPVASADPCASGPAARLATTQLSLRAEAGALPLGSRQVEMMPWQFHYASLRSLALLEQHVSATRNDKAQNVACTDMAGEKVAASTAFEDELALAERLSQKAQEQVMLASFGGRLTQVGPAVGHPAERRHVDNIELQVAATSTAKAPGTLPARAAAAMIAGSAAVYARAKVPGDTALLDR